MMRIDSRTVPTDVIRVSFSAILTILLLCSLSPAHAAVLTVTSTADDGSAGTLRQVIAAASASDTITFSPTVFATFQLIDLTQGTINIAQNLTINGPPAGVAVNARSEGNIFTVGPAAAAIVSMSNLTLENGATTGSVPGGAIAVNGSLTLTNCTIQANSASNGGGIFLDPLGTLTVDNCTLYGNLARGSGGGIYVGNGGTLNLTNDTFLENNADAGNGGAIFDTLGATLNITNSTFEHNFATGPTASGGAIYSDGANITIANSIFGSDFASPTGETEIDSTSTNSNFPPTVSVTTSDIFVPGAGSQFGALNFDPQFLVGGNYGGLVLTLPLAIGSPCYGAGTAALAPATDARGFTRPNPPSMGAFDLPYAVAPPPVITPISGFLQSVAEVTIGSGVDLISGTVIYVTTNGTTPTTSSPVYNGPFNTVGGGTETVQAINTIPGYIQSPPASATYFITSAAPSYPAGLQLFSVPYGYPRVALDTLFGFTGVKLAVWDPSVSEYDIMTGTGSIEPGVGYWGRFPQAVTFTSIGTPAPPNVPFTINLKPGWNQIGDPYSVSLSISSLTFGSNNITFAQASSGPTPLIGATVYSYDPTANNNAGGYDAATVLSPEVGYWIFASANTTMLVPPL